jgi:hypothetical protein
VVRRSDDDALPLTRCELPPEDVAAVPALFGRAMEAVGRTDVDRDQPIECLAPQSQADLFPPGS